MSFLLKKNNAKSTVAVAIDASVQSLTVVDASKFPATGNFLVTIWDKEQYPDPGDDTNMEIVLVTDVTANVFTITRAQESTIGVGHGLGHAVELLITAGIITELEDAISEKLSTDQTVPQDVVSGKPRFIGGVDVTSIYGMNLLIVTGYYADTYILTGTFSGKPAYEGGGEAAGWWIHWDNINNLWVQEDGKTNGVNLGVYAANATLEGTWTSGIGGVAVKYSWSIPVDGVPLFNFGINTTKIYDDNAGVKAIDISSRTFYDKSEIAMFHFGEAGAAPIFDCLAGATGGFVKADTSGQLSIDANTYLASGGWYDTSQGSVYLSGFYNDLGNYGGWVTYYDTISYADSAGSAGSAYSSSYCDDFSWSWCYSAPPYDGSVYGYQNGGWVTVAGDTSFTDWRGGTIYQPTGPCQFDDNATTPTKFVRLWNTANGSLSEWWDGTNTLTIGGASGMSYIAGASDVIATRVTSPESVAHFIDAGTSFFAFGYSLTNADTNTVQQMGYIGRKTTGAAANGIGAEFYLRLTNDVGEQVNVGSIGWVETDVTDGGEDSQLILSPMIAGALVPVLTLDSIGASVQGDIKAVGTGATGVILYDTTLAGYYRITLDNGALVITAI